MSRPGVERAMSRPRFTKTVPILLLCLAAALPNCEKDRPDGSGAAKAPQEAPDIPIDVMPKLVSNPAPSYPEEARLRREEGTVFVKALVGADGQVAQVAVDETKPAPAALTRAALDAVKQWRFEPATAKGKPVEVWIAVPVRFRLQ